MAARVENRTREIRSWERAIPAFGDFLLCAGIFGLAIAVTKAGWPDDDFLEWGENGLSAAWLLVALIALSLGITARFVCNLCGDLFRIMKQKKKITMRVDEKVCSVCMSVLTDEDPKQCRLCGSTFEE